MSIRGITFVNQIVKSDDDASLHNMLLSGRSGVMRGCDTTFDSSHIYVASGQFVILGRQVEVQGTETITPEAVTEGKKYCRLVFEIDLSKTNTTETFGQGYFKVLSSSVSYPDVTQEDLLAGGTIYQYPWARFTLTVSGIANFANDTTVLQFSIDEVLSAVSENPVQNKVVHEALKEKLGKTETAANSNKLGGQAPDYYAKAENFIPGDNYVVARSSSGQSPDGYQYQLYAGNGGLKIMRSKDGWQTMEPWLDLSNYLGKGNVRLGYITFDNNSNALIIYIDGVPYSIPFSADACPPGNFKGTAKIANGVQSHTHNSVDCTNMTIPQLKALLETWADSDAVNISDFNIYTTRVSDNFANLWNSGDATSVIGWGGWWYWVKIGADTTTEGFQKFLVSGYLGTEIYYVENRMGVWSKLRPLLHSENIGSYALPLSGGDLNGMLRVYGADNVPCSINTTTDGSSYTAYSNKNGILGMLGFSNINTPAFWDANWNYSYPLLHTGNSAKVAIQSTAPTDGLWVW